MKTFNEYDKQAYDFIESTGLKIEARYKKFGKYSTGDTTDRDIWEIKMTRGKREYIFDYGDSITNHENWLKEIWKKRPNSKELFMDTKEDFQNTQKQIARNNEANWELAEIGHRPRAYDILACLTQYEPEDNINDFASEFGYTKPSEAIKVYEAVKKEWQMIKELFTDEEIEQLQEIQ